MTTSDERTRAILKTYDFLLELSRNNTVSEQIRNQAVWCLRHFPTASDLSMVAWHWPKENIASCPFADPIEHGEFDK